MPKLSAYKKPAFKVLSRSTIVMTCWRRDLSFPGRARGIGCEKDKRLTSTVDPGEVRGSIALASDCMGRRFAVPSKSKLAGPLLTFHEVGTGKQLIKVL